MFLLPRSRSRCRFSHIMMPMIAEADPLATRSSDPESKLGDSGRGVNNKTQLFTNTCESNEILTAPISLPLINIDNVITPENPSEYTPWKRILCVDGLIRYLPVNDDNIVITNPPLTRKRKQMKTDWIEIANKSVLPIMCNNIKAELHKERFGSGSRGQCIRCNGIWYTPNEFEIMCGRTANRNWKRSIEFEGRRIQVLIDNGILVPHALRCTCVICCYDESSMSSILLFAPYSYQNCVPEPNEKKPKIDNQTNNDRFSKKAWQKIAESPDPGFPPSLGGVLKRLNKINQTLVRLMRETKHCVEQVKTIGCKQMQEKIASSTEPVEASLLNVDGTEAEACANCKRKALSECSFRRRTPYCSTFCENKD